MNHKLVVMAQILLLGILSIIQQINDQPVASSILIVGAGLISALHYWEMKKNEL